MSDSLSKPDSTVNIRRSDFALPDDTMFINTIILRVAKEKEVTFVTVSGLEHTGFITGIDDEWIQITTTKDRRLVLLNILNVESIEETGKTIRSVDLSREDKERIKKYALTVYVKAKEITRVSRERKQQSQNTSSYVDSIVSVDVEDFEDYEDDS